MSELKKKSSFFGSFGKTSSAARDASLASSDQSTPDRAASPPVGKDSNRRSLTGMFTGRSHRGSSPPRPARGSSPPRQAISAAMEGLARAPGAAAGKAGSRESYRGAGLDVENIFGAGQRGDRSETVTLDEGRTIRGASLLFNPPPPPPKATTVTTVAVVHVRADQPLGLTLDERRFVLAVAPGGQAEAAGVRPGNPTGRYAMLMGNNITCAAFSCLAGREVFLTCSRGALFHLSLFLRFHGLTRFLHV